MGILKAAFDIRGRTRRLNFWLLLIGWLAAIVLVVAIQYVDESRGGFWGALTTIVYLLGLLLVILSGIRRMHDLDRTGWWMLLWLTGIGGIVLLAFFSTAGTSGPNNYGPDPKRRRPATARPT